MLFYNVLFIFTKTKVAHFMKFSPKNPVNFKHASATFIATLFRTKKANLPIFLIINLKGYEILVVKFIEKFTD